MILPTNYFENDFVDTVRAELHKPGSDIDYSGITVSRAEPIYSVHTPDWPIAESDQIFHFDLFGTVDQPNRGEIKTELDRSVALPSSMEGVQFALQTLTMHPASDVPQNED